MAEVQLKYGAFVPIKEFIRILLSRYECGKYLKIITCLGCFKTNWNFPKKLKITKKDLKKYYIINEWNEDNIRCEKYKNKNRHPKVIICKNI